MSDYEFGYAEGQSEMYTKIERLEATIAELTEAARERNRGHDEFCAWHRVSRQAACDCGHDALAALIKEKTNG